MNTTSDCNTSVSFHNLTSTNNTSRILNSRNNYNLNSLNALTLVNSIGNSLNYGPCKSNKRIIHKKNHSVAADRKKILTCSSQIDRLYNDRKNNFIQLSINPMTEGNSSKVDKSDSISNNKRSLYLSTNSFNNRTKSYGNKKCFSSDNERKIINLYENTKKEIRSFRR